MYLLNCARFCCLVLAVCLLGVLASSAQTLTTLYTFAGQSDGGAPAVPLTQGTDGNFYGTTLNGGPSCGNGNGTCGTIFQFTSSGTLNTLQSLYEGGPLLQDPNGQLQFYGLGDGELYSLIPGGSIVNLATASGSAPLTVDTKGNFWGTTGATVFEATPAGVLTTVYNFGGDGPWVGGANSGVVQGVDGDFYGTTVSGGIGECPHDTDCGTVFKLTPTGTLTTLYEFCSQPSEPPCTDGYYPGGLVQGSDGNFYGVTSQGGADGACASNIPGGNCGTIFKITPTGTFTTLHSFTWFDGGGPSTLIQATDGNFYGTTTYGGASYTVGGLGYGDGTIFRMTPDGTLTTLFNFDGTDGGFASNALLQAKNGIFYGTTQGGGANNAGTIFSFSIGLGGTTPSATSLTLSPSEVTIGSAGPVVLTATVAPASGSGTPTGAVAFYVGSTQIAISSLQNGVATYDYNPSALPLNSYELTASYVGDATYAISDSSAQTLTVSSLPQAATPTFSPAAGSYNSPQTVTISDTTSGVTLFYTNDGTTPTTSSAVYNGPIAVNSTQTLQAIAAGSNNTNSAVGSAAYTITSNPSYQLSVSPATLSIVAGQSGTATFTVTPMNGFNSPVAFECSGLPAGAACTFNPTSVTPNGNPVTSMLTLSTTAPSTALRGVWPGTLGPIYSLFLPSAGMMLLWLRRRKSRILVAPFAVGALLTLLMLLPSCGSSGIKGTGGGGGTPPGMNTVTVSAATSGSGSISQSATLTITITQ
jgi:uncharacterized repeat protein (TIGR03803 family)